MFNGTNITLSFYVEQDTYFRKMTKKQIQHTRGHWQICKP